MFYPGRGDREQLQTLEYIRSTVESDWENFSENYEIEPNISYHLTSFPRERKELHIDGEKYTGVFSFEDGLQYNIRYQHQEIVDNEELEPVDTFVRKLDERLSEDI